MTSPKYTKKKSTYPGSLADLNRFRRSIHGPHDGSSRIVMVRKTDQRTFASIRNGKEPTFETVTRETVETFSGQRTACKITTERKDREEKVPPDLEPLVNERRSKSATPTRKVRPKQSEFQMDCLEAHNLARRKHGVPPLKLNKEMCKTCQDHANFLVRKNIVQHSNNRKYGESVYCVQSNNSNIDVKGSEPVDCWYEEIKKHDFNHEPKLLASGQFTQVVWKETRELGVAIAKCGGRVVVVAHYYPPGNIMGCFIANVPPPLPTTPELNNNNESLLDNVSKSFKEICLDAHNKYRKLHGVKPLKLDSQLCRFSEEWAKQCAERGTMEHRKNNPNGENIFCVGLHSIDPSVIITGSTPVDTWYAESEKHVYGKEPASLKTGHFTQIVWKTTEKLGVGVAKRNGYIYVVANYSPAGNFVGHFAENVLPIGSIPSPENEDCNFTEVPEFSQFELDALKVHNEYRKKHGVPLLKLNKKLCEYATEWAQHCCTAGLVHRPKNEYGENLFKETSSDYSCQPTAKEVVSSWYSQKQKHVFGVECVNLNTLHFTQVIWKESSELGVAMAKNNKGETFVVANYHPKGNIAGQFNANVPKAKI